MGVAMAERRMSPLGLVGIGLVLVLAGCASESGDDGAGNTAGNGNVGNGIQAGMAGMAANATAGANGAATAGTGNGANVGNNAAGTAGTGVNPAGGAAGTGAAGDVGGAGTGVNPAAGTAGTGTGTAGAGTGTAGTGSGTGGGTGAAGTGGGTGGGTGAGTGGGGTGGGEAVCDTSGFLQNCVQDASAWGTDQQSGPCAGGTTIYGVQQDFGPYGVRYEYNVGQGFENSIDPSDNASGCSGFIDSFGADPLGSATLKDIHDLDLSLYSVFYPGCMPEGEKFPLLTWANGTCAMPEGYGPLLRYVASFGYIVVAANSRYTGSGIPIPPVRAIDFMFAANDDPNSKYYQKIDTDKVGTFGHSQGGGAAVATADDSRVKTVVIFNGGNSASKPYLAIGGEGDLLDFGPSPYANAVSAATRPAAYIYYWQVPAEVNGSTTGFLAPGHLTLMMESERVIEPTRAWFDMILKGKDSAKQMFIGDGCTLCDGTAYGSMWDTGASPPTLEYGKNNMLQ